MKKNRIAAGALALALGLGAVAPAVAAETPNEKQIITEEFKSARQDYAVAIKNVNALKKAATEAEKAVNKAMDELAEKVKEEKETKRKNQQAIVDIDEQIGLYDESKPEEKIIIESLKKKRKDLVDFQTKSDKEVTDATKAARDALAEAEKAQGSDEVSKIGGKSLSEWEDDKTEAYEALKNQGALLSSLELAEKYQDAELVKPAPEKEEKEEKPADKTPLEQIKEARLDNLATLKAVEKLEAKTPNFAKKYAEELKAYKEEARELLKQADAYIKNEEKKVSLISTAYAAEEEVVDVENIDPNKLLEDLKANEAKGDDLLEKGDKEVENSEKPADGKPADENAEKDKDNLEEGDKEVENSEKPADGKPADENAEKDKDNKDKKDNKDNKDDKKKAEKPAKKAGSNAKTGIAGVAGVAGILAAASVAYAASKRD